MSLSKLSYDAFSGHGIDPALWIQVTDAASKLGADLNGTYVMYLFTYFITIVRYS